MGEKDERIRKAMIMRDDPKQFLGTCKSVDQSRTLLKNLVQFETFSKDADVAGG
jgi:hypothetical protein